MFVGANTVYEPFASSVASKPALCKAATKMLKLLALLAKAALANNQTDKALEHLFKISPEQQLKVVKLWLASGDSSAIESQMRVSAESKKATALELKLYTEVSVQQQHFTALEEFLPRLLRQKVFSSEQWTRVFSAYFSAQPVDKITSK